MRIREFKILQTKAYEYIKKRIVDGTMAFNKVYSETGLAQELGISRTPVRDAVHLLYQEGLVEIIPNKGFVLHKLNEQDVMETYEVRSAIEGYCVRKLALEKDEERKRAVLEALRRSVDLQQSFFENGRDIERFVDEDHNFHCLLVKNSGNDAFDDIFSVYMHWIKKLAASSLAKDGRMEQTLAEHRLILDAISSGDGLAAYDALLYHMRSPLDFNLESIYQ